jgi:phthiodiolone/phenolphthiodiolone dimycocerosates ketoreductase
MGQFVPALTQICLIGDEGEVAEMLERPMVKSIILMLTARDLAPFGYDHPMGPDWRGIQDFDPVRLSRETIIRFCDELDTQAIRDIFPVGTPRQVAAKLKGFADAGMRVFKAMDYGGMAGAKFAARSAQKVIEVEDEVLRLCA